MTCRDCIYNKVCPKAKHIENYHLTDGCSDFKNKEDFVEIVRCKNCKHSSKDKRYGTDEDCLMCDMWGYDLVETEANAFCSYGERKEN